LLLVGKPLGLRSKTRNQRVEEIEVKSLLPKREIFKGKPEEFEPEEVVKEVKTLFFNNQN